MGAPSEFEACRARLNVGLGLSGLYVGEDGRVAKLANRARTLTEAEERADALGTELRRRNVHPDVLIFCRAELLPNGYFHAVLEACKSVSDKIQQRTGLTGDGEELFGPAFSLRDQTPPLAFNRLEDGWEQSEHRGLATLIRGVFGTYRNPTAHAPKVRWATDGCGALDF